MSKTDKTDPPWTRVNDPDVINWVNHSGKCLSGGACDLPSKPKVERVPSTECHYAALESVGRHGRLKSLCGCSMCMMSAERAMENRKQRRSAKREIQKELDLE